MKKKNLVALSALVLFAVAVFAGLGYVWNQFKDYSTVLTANWGIALPKESQYWEIYSRDSGASFLGDGVRYHIFSYKEAEPVSQMLPWDKAEGKTLFHSSYREAVTDWLTGIHVPAENMPDYSKCLYGYVSKEDNSEIIVLWDSSKSRIYVAESFL